MFDCLFWMPALQLMRSWNLVMLCRRSWASSYDQDRSLTTFLRAHFNIQTHWCGVCSLQSPPAFGWCILCFYLLTFALELSSSTCRAWFLRPNANFTLDFHVTLFWSRLGKVKVGIDIARCVSETPTCVYCQKPRFPQTQPVSICGYSEHIIVDTNWTGVNRFLELPVLRINDSLKHLNLWAAFRFPNQG